MKRVRDQDWLQKDTFADRAFRFFCESYSAVAACSLEICFLVLAALMVIHVLVTAS